MNCWILFSLHILVSSIIMSCHVLLAPHLHGYPFICVVKSNIPISVHKVQQLIWKIVIVVTCFSVDGCERWRWGRVRHQRKFEMKIGVLLRIQGRRPSSSVPLQRLTPPRPAWRRRGEGTGDNARCATVLDCASSGAAPGPRRVGWLWAPPVCVQEGIMTQVNVQAGIVSHGVPSCWGEVFLCCSVRPAKLLQENKSFFN